MEFEATSNGFILEVDGEHGPTIEWMAKEGELIILLPTLNKHGRLDRDGKSYVVTHLPGDTPEPRTTPPLEKQGGQPWRDRV